MTDTSKATPRPWRVVTGAIMIAAGRHRGRIAADQEAMADAIATKKETAVARAEYIVTAVNAYGAMREALRLAIHGLDTDGPASAAATLNVQGRAALAAAEGKETPQ